MIKFFRKIRYKLMSENKTTRYFKYAIGEIVLVVIGILIALQINNWNENRKRQLEAKNYKQTIVNDLVQDTLSINTLIKETKVFKKNIKDYFHYINSLQPSSTNLKKLSDSLSNVVFLYKKYYPVNNSFKQMETSGKANLLTKKQRDFLLELLAYQEEINIIIDGQLEIAEKNNDKRKVFSGYPNNIYKKLNVKNTIDRQVQSLIHAHLWMKAVDDLYHYIKNRGGKTKKMIQDNIHLFIEE